MMTPGWRWSAVYSNWMWLSECTEMKSIAVVTRTCGCASLSLRRQCHMSGTDLLVRRLLLTLTCHPLLPSRIRRRRQLRPIRCLPNEHLRLPVHVDDEGGAAATVLSVASQITAPGTVRQNRELPTLWEKENHRRPTWTSTCAVRAIIAYLILVVKGL